MTIIETIQSDALLISLLSAHKQCHNANRDYGLMNQIQKRVSELFDISESDYFADDVNWAGNSTYAFDLAYHVGDILGQNANPPEPSN